MAGKLTPKQRLFVAEYMIDRNASRAAVAAGYSENGAGVQGHRMLKNANVAAEIAKRAEKQAGRLEITAEKVLNELALMGFARMDNYIGITEQGEAYIDLRGVKKDPSLAAAIQELTVDEYTEGRGEEARDIKRVRFKLADKRGSLELLGKHLKLWTDKHEIKLDDLGQLSDEQLAGLIARLTGSAGAAA